MYTLIIIAVLGIMLFAYVWSNNDSKKLDKTVFTESTSEPVVEEQPTVVVDSKVVDLKEVKKASTKKKPTSKKKSQQTKK